MKNLIMNTLKSNIFTKLFFVSFIALGNFNFVVAMNQTNQIQQGNNQECAICFTNDSNVELNCGHSFCSECLRTTFEPAANGHSLTSLRCPDPECRREINNDTLRRLGFNDNHLENIATLRRPVQIDTTDPLIRQITKPCPNCNVPIEKNTGCLHMTCTRCRHEFYWCCLRPWPIFLHGGYVGLDRYYGVCSQEITPEEAHRRLRNKGIVSTNIKPIALIVAMSTIGGYIWHKSKKNRTTTPKDTKDQIEKTNLANHIAEQNQKAKLAKKETNKKTSSGKSYSIITSTKLKIVNLPIKIKNIIINKFIKQSLKMPTN